VVATASLDPARDLWLREHTILEDPLLPAVFGVEFLVEVALEAAARILHGAQGLPCEEWQFVALRELSIESGVAVLGREPLALQVEAVPVVRSATRAVFATSLSLLGGRRCYRAWVEVEALATRDEAWVGLPQSSHNERALEDFLAQTRPEALARTRRTSGSAVYARIRLGPSFQILEEAYAGEEGSALGFSPNSDALLRWPLSVAERERGGRAWASEPALLEAAFHCAAWWGLATEDRVIVPRALGALRCLRVASPGARRAFFAKARSGEARGLFDLWVFEWVAGRWETLFAVDGYETYDVSGISSWGTSNPDHSSQGKKRGGS
jgi:hypothetical protein